MHDIFLIPSNDGIKIYIRIKPTLLGGKLENCLVDIEVWLINCRLNHLWLRECPTESSPSGQFGCVGKIYKRAAVVGHCAAVTR